MRKVILTVAALVASGFAWAEEGKGILDFSSAPRELAPARLVEIDGKPVNAPISKTSFWLEPGDHRITMTAAIDDSMGVGTINIERKTDPGTVTITVEAGKRYHIAAQVKDHKGNWEPVIWKEEDVK